MALTSEMQQHLNGTTTLAVFLKITARDGTILRVCNCTRNKVIDGETYYAYPITPTILQTTNGLKPDNLEITAVYSELFTAATLRAKKWLGARVEYRTMNYKDFSMGHAVRRVGFVGQTKIDKYAATPELKSLSQKLSEPVGRTCNEDCDVVELGDARCKVDLSGNTLTGYRMRTNAHITSVVNPQRFTIAFDQTIKPSVPGTTIAPDKFYHRGKFVFSSGSNSGVEGQILNNEGNTLTLLLALFYQPQVGDTLQLTVGCDRKIATCRDVFGNAINNRSFYCLPGRSKVLRIPD